MFFCGFFCQILFDVPCIDETCVSLNFLVQLSFNLLCPRSEPHIISFLLYIAAYIEAIIKYFTGKNRQIIRYDSKGITMKNNNKISIGKSYREAFLDCQLSELEEIKP